MPTQEEGIKLFGKTITVTAAAAKATMKEENNPHAGDSPSKPEKIIPCPRCKSMETKFCYFNNYNVNQPRHFCRACHRYWTAGGALRNVPVGAGRRRNKPPGGVRISPPPVGFPDGAAVEEWRLAAAVAAGVHGGGFRDVFPIKRRRCDSGGQPCVN
ncbi:unnamed protein product [Linum trigynum]|uniref:Dof-type domain-containing protein n=1 Tax=Linum trigynum TaxID=586398 RepID=A0AAV2GI35_9ROSI